MFWIFFFYRSFRFWKLWHISCENFLNTWILILFRRKWIFMFKVPSSGLNRSCVYTAIMCLMNKIVLSLCRYHTKGNVDRYDWKMCECTGSYITTHSIYFLLFLRCLFFFVCLCVCVCMPLVLSPVGYVFCYRLPTHMSVVAYFIHCDNAYSYEDNFIYLYSHYDLSMRWHNKGFNEFDSCASFWLQIHHRLLHHNFCYGISMKFHRLCISKTASDCMC